MPDPIGPRRPRSNSVDSQQPPPAPAAGTDARHKAQTLDVLVRSERPSRGNTTTVVETSSRHMSAYAFTNMARTNNSTAQRDASQLLLFSQTPETTKALLDYLQRLTSAAELLAQVGLPPSAETGGLYENAFDLYAQVSPFRMAQEASLEFSHKQALDRAPENNAAKRALTHLTELQDAAFSYMRASSHALSLLRRPAFLEDEHLTLLLSDVEALLANYNPLTNTPQLIELLNNLHNGRDTTVPIDDVVQVEGGPQPSGAASNAARLRAAYETAQELTIASIQTWDEAEVRKLHVAVFAEISSSDLLPLAESQVAQLAATWAGQYEDPARALRRSLSGPETPAQPGNFPADSVLATVRFENMQHETLAQLQRQGSVAINPLEHSAHSVALLDGANRLPVVGGPARGGRLNFSHRQIETGTELVISLPTGSSMGRTHYGVETPFGTWFLSAQGSRLKLRAPPQAGFDVLVSVRGASQSFTAGTNLGNQWGKGAQNSILLLDLASATAVLGIDANQPVEVRLELIRMANAQQGQPVESEQLSAAELTRQAYSQDFTFDGT